MTFGGWLVEYLNEKRKGLAWHMIRDPRVLIEVFEQWLELLSDRQKGDLRIFHLAWSLRRIDEAIELAKDHSPSVARFCNDVAAGNAPKITDGIKHLNAPLDSCEEYLEYWEFELRQYLEFFDDHLIVSDYMNSEDGKKLRKGQLPWPNETQNMTWNLVTPEEVALMLKAKNIIKSPKTLKNTYKAAWGPPDGKEGNAELFDWNRIQPIVEGQFEVEFAD